MDGVVLRATYSRNACGPTQCVCVCVCVYGHTHSKNLQSLTDW